MSFPRMMSTANHEGFFLLLPEAVPGWQVRRAPRKKNHYLDILQTAPAYIDDDMTVGSIGVSGRDGGNVPPPARESRLQVRELPTGSLQKDADSRSCSGTSAMTPLSYRFRRGGPDRAVDLSRDCRFS